MQVLSPTLTAQLKINGIKALNPMQVNAIEAYSKNPNLILLSNTGTGKTLAFLLSVLPQLETAKNGTKILIITPSRELAIQIEKVFKSLSLPNKITSCYGGHKREIEENNLTEAPDVIVGTPGRLADHIRRTNINTNTIETLIIDEYDKLLELNFIEEMAFIVREIKNLKNKILTSATTIDAYPDYLKLANATILNYITTDTKEALSLSYLKCADKDKLEEAHKLLCMLGGRPSIIFCNHRDSVERVSDFLNSKSLPNVFYHGAMEQHERDAALCKFRNGSVYFLVTTDLASRGLDIANIRNIIHYHLPPNEETFIHRNGRTARMEASGAAIVMLGPEESLPHYMESIKESVQLPANAETPDKPKWTTLFFAAGKKDKVNKIDIVGFLTNKGQLRAEDIGLIEVKDFAIFVAVKKFGANHLIQLIKDQKLKGKKIKIALAK